MQRRMFASDNASGAHPAVIEALRAANEGHAYAYGDDEWTRAAEEVLKRHLGETARPFFVFNGTGANATALAAVMRPYEAVICPATAHINVDECGAPERFSGGKLIPIATPDGRLTPELVEQAIFGVGSEHHSQPRVVSISQASEYGTVYSPEQIAALAEVAHAHRMLLHVDGARISNAAASSGSSLRRLLTDSGVDVVSFGGTKNGMLYGEAVVFLREGLGEDFRFVRKQGAQLASKMRFIAAQFVALFGSDLWLANARHANEMARLLADGMSSLGIRITQPVEANEVFAILPRESIEPLVREFGFYVWDERSGEVRWVTSWDTTPGDVSEFVEAARRVLSGA
ncbi:MAG: low specificity L-threonine aldolase [Coriobacteriia bacterium]|nr:low specificity L-threonine aldolase [Coriobacteriia bacterium]